MGESAPGGCSGSWGNGARAKSVNHSISKINGMFWSSLPFVSAEWPVQRQAGTLQPRCLYPLWIMKRQRHRVWLHSVPPAIPARKGPVVRRGYSSVLT